MTATVCQSGYDAPLRELVPSAHAASDIGLRIVYARRFGGWAGADRSDPLVGGDEAG